MKKTLWWLFGGFFLLFILFIILSPFFIKIDHFRPKIELALQEKLLGKISIGQLQLSIIKGIEIRISDVKIKNPDGFPEDLLLQAPLIRVQLGTLASLFGKPRIKIILDDPIIKCLTNSDGNLNIFSLLKKENTEISKPKEAPSSRTFMQGFLIAFIAKSKFIVSVNKGNLLYQENKGTWQTFSELNISSSPLNLQSPVELSISGIANFTREGSLSIYGPFSTKISLSNPLNTSKPNQYDATLDTTETAINTPLYQKPKGEKCIAHIIFSQSNKQITISELKLELDWASLNLKAAIKNETQPSFQVDISAFLFTPKSARSDSKKYFESDTHLNFFAQGLLKPLLIQTGKGHLEIKKLSGEIPFILKSVLKKLKIGMEGNASLKGFSDFSIKNNEPTRVEFKDLEFDLSPATLNIDQKFSFHLKDIIKIRSFIITGNPLVPETLDVTGNISAPSVELLLENQNFGNENWHTQGSALFSLLSTFHIEKNKINKLILSSKIDLTNSELRFKDEFIKPKNKKLYFELVSDTHDDILSLKTVALQYHTAKIMASGTITHPLDQKKRFVSLNIDLPLFSLADWNTFFPKLKKKFHGEARIQSLKIAFPTQSLKDISMQGDLAFNKVGGEFPEDLIKTENMKLSGPFELDINGNFSFDKRHIEKFSLDGKMDLSAMAISYKEAFRKSKKIPFTIQTHINSHKNDVDMRNCKISLKNMEIDAVGKAFHITKNPVLDITISTSKFFISDLSEFIPSLQKPSFSGDVRFETRVRGSLAKEEPLKFDTTFFSNELTYNPPPSLNNHPEPKKNEPIKKETNIDLFYQTPGFKKLHVNGKASITKLLLKTYKLWNISANFRLNHQLLSLSPLTFQIYNGKFSSTASMDLRKREPITAVESSLKDLNIENFLTSQKSKAAGKLSGIFDAKLKLFFSGLETPIIKKTISGDGAISMHDGYFKLFNLSEALAGIPVIEQVIPGIEFSDNFKYFRSSVFIKNQEVITPDMVLQGKNHLLKCRGKLNFDGSLNYDGNYYLNPTENTTKVIPFTVGGTISDPKPSPDVGALLGTTVQNIMEGVLKPKDTSPPQQNEPQENPKKNKKKNVLEDLLEKVGGQ